MRFTRFHWFSHQGIWTIIHVPCSTHMTLWSVGVFLGGVYVLYLSLVILYIFWLRFLKQLFHSRSLDMRWKIANSALRSTKASQIQRAGWDTIYIFRVLSIFFYVVHNCLYCDAVWCPFRQQVLVWNFQVFVSLFYCHGNFVELSLET